MLGETLGLPPVRLCLQRSLTKSSVYPDSPASTVLALRQSASHDAASLPLPLSPAPVLALLGFLEEADTRLSGAQRWFRLHLTDKTGHAVSFEGLDVPWYVPRFPFEFPLPTFVTISSGAMASAPAKAVFVFSYLTKRGSTRPLGEKINTEW